MLKRTEGYRRQRERGSHSRQAREVEMPHVGFDELRPRLHGLGLARQFLSTSRQHRRARVQSDDLGGRLRRGNQNPARTAADLEYRPTRVARHLNEEGDILPLAVGCDVVVELCHQPILIVTGQGVHRVNDLLSGARRFDCIYTAT